jgi:hypothetical protein
MLTLSVSQSDPERNLTPQMSNGKPEAPAVVRA